MIRRLAFALALVLALTGFALPASATPLLVSGGGTFSQYSSTTALSTPGGTYAFSFQVDSNPAVTFVDPGYNFYIAYTNFTYTLNGVSIAVAPTNMVIDVKRTTVGGLLTLYIDDHRGFDFLNPIQQIYSGDETSPTILAGSYTTRTTNFFADDPGDPSANAGDISSIRSPLTITPLVAATPEPSSIALLGTGLLGMAGMVRRRFRGSAPDGADHAI